MYENFFFLAIAALFFYTYLNEKEEYLVKDIWFIIGAVFLFASFFFNYTLTGLTSYPSYNATLNATVTNVHYIYQITPDLSPYALGAGIILLIIIFAFIMKTINKYMKMIQ